MQLTDKVVSLNPIGSPIAYLYNAAANFNQANLAAAEISARRFQALDPEHERPQVYLLLADILASEGDYAGAVEQEKVFLRIVPNDYDARGIKQQVNVWEGLLNRGKASLVARDNMWAGSRKLTAPFARAMWSTKSVIPSWPNPWTCPYGTKCKRSGSCT